MALYTPEQLKEMLWYFAHPYTVKDKEGRNSHIGEEANFNLACVRTGELAKRGYRVYSPIAHTHPVHVRSPEFIKNDEYKFWIDLDNLFIDKTEFNGIILAPNWENSSGARGERAKIEPKSKIVLLYQHLMLEPILYDIPTPQRI